MKKHNEDRIETGFRQSGKLCDEIDVCSIEGKQLNLCRAILSFVM